MNELPLLERLLCAKQVLYDDKVAMSKYFKVSFL